MVKESTKRALVGATFATLLTTMMLGAVQFAFNVYVARTRGEAALGELNALIGIAFVLTVPAIAFAFPGGRAVAIAFGRGDIAQAAGLSGFVFVLSTIASAAALPIGLGLLAATGGIAAAPIALAFVAILVILRGQLMVTREIILAHRLPSVLSWSSVLASITTFLLLAADFALGGVQLLPEIAYTAFFAVFAIASLGGLWRRDAFGDWRSSAPVERRNLLEFATVAAFGTAVGFALTWLIVPITLWFAGPAAAGHTAAALSVAQLVFLLSRVMQPAITPEIVQSYARGDRDSIKSLTEAGTRLALIGTCLGAGAMIALRAPILGLFFGPGFAPAEALLILCCVNFVVQTAFNIPILGLSIIGHVKFSSLVSVPSIALAGFLWWLVGDSMGALGIILVVVSVYVFIAIATLAYGKRRLGYSWSTFAPLAVFACASGLSLAPWIAGIGPAHDTLFGATLSLGLFLVVFAPFYAREALQKSLKALGLLRVG